MGDDNLCPVCSRDIKPNQHAVECAGCCSWLHKGCSGLTNTDFNKISSLAKKTGSHKWECKSCRSVDVRRVSMGPSNASGEANCKPRTRKNARDGGSLGDDGSEVTPDGVTFVSSKISGLLNDPDVTYKDLINVMLHMFNVLLDQSSQIRGMLNEFRESQKQNEIKMLAMEKEIEDLRSLVHSENIMDARPAGDTPQTDPCRELQERSERAKNIIIYNVKESQSKVPDERIDHDKSHVSSLLRKIGVETNPDFAVIRLGRSNDGSRPMKVIFGDASMAMSCIRQKSKLKGSDVSIKQDLTIMQRGHLKSLLTELKTRKDNGENNLGIRYNNGIPYIASYRDHENKISKNGKI